MNSDHQLQAATKKLPVSAILFGILAGFIGVGGRTDSRLCSGLGPRGCSSRLANGRWGRLFCRRNRAHRDAHRYAKLDSSRPLLARDKRDLALRRFDRGLLSRSAPLQPPDSVFGMRVNRMF